MKKKEKKRETETERETKTPSNIPHDLTELFTTSLIHMGFSAKSLQVT
jgi:hypothetical protein